MSSLTGFKKYFANFSWLVLEKVCRLGVSFVVAAYVARYLGPRKYGLLNFAISFTSFFTVFVTLGLDGIIARNLVRDPAGEPLIMGTGFRLRILGSITGFAIVLAVIYLIGYDFQTKMLIAVVAVGMLFQPLGVIEPLFQSRVAGRQMTLANLWTIGATSAFRLILVALKATLTAFAWVVAIEKAVQGIAYVAYYRRSGRRGGVWKFSPGLAKELLRDSWPLIFSGLVVMIYMRIDQVMIKEMMSNEAVGYYSAAVYLAEGWYFLGIAASSSLFPAIVKSKSISEALYHDRLQRFYRLMAWMAISVALPVHFMADFLIALIYGPAFHPAAEVLKVNIWTGVFVFLGVASSSWLVTENLQRISLIRTVIGAVLNIVLNLVLIPRNGIVGSAWATLISQAFASYICYAFTRVTFRTFIMQTKAFYPPIRELLDFRAASA